MIAHTGRWLRPEAFHRGDVVVYDVGGLGVPSYFVGPFVDRVVGAPGDCVEFKQGVLLVNGQKVLADRGPLRSLTDVPDLTIKAGRREYVIFPSSLPVDTDEVVRLIPNASRVPDNRIVGKVFWRVSPLHRFGRVE